MKGGRAVHHRPLIHMNQRGREIKIGGKVYRLVFTTQAYLEIEEKFGGLDGMSKKIDKTKDKNAPKIYAWLIALLANQGIEIDNMEKGENTPFLTEKKVLLFMSPIEFARAKIEFMGAINDGMRREIQDEDENDEDEVLNQIKNARGAAEA